MGQGMPVVVGLLDKEVIDILAKGYPVLDMASMNNALLCICLPLP